MVVVSSEETGYLPGFIFLGTTYWEISVAIVAVFNNRSNLAYFQRITVSKGIEV